MLLTSVLLASVLQTRVLLTSVPQARVPQASALRRCVPRRRPGVVVLEPRPGSLLEGSLWHPDPSTLSGDMALRVLADIGRARSFLAALEALAVERVRLACADEARAAAERGGRSGPERFGGDVAHALAVSEVATAEAISEFAAARLVNASEALCGPQLAVLTRLEGGLLSEAHARVITDETATLPEAVAGEFGLECLRRLETRGGRRRAPGEFRKAVRSLRERLHPDSIRARRARAVRDRGVWVRPESDGMCTLSALLPAEVGLAAVGRIDGIARAARRADPEEGRTLPQLRADVLAGLLIAGADTCPAGRPAEGSFAETEVWPATAELRSAYAEPRCDAAEGWCADPQLGGRLAEPGSAYAEPRRDAAEGWCADPQLAGRLAEPGSANAEPMSDAGGRGTGVVPEGVPRPTAEIVVHISADSLLGLSDEPAMLDGHGPIDAETARALAVVAPTWQLLSTGTDGVPLSLGRTAYRPPKRLRRFIEYRDGSCVFPGCSRAARTAEIDHIIEWQDGGATDADNLQALCEKHHALKSLSLWNPTRLTAEEGQSCGDVLWVSPLGARTLGGPVDRELGNSDCQTPTARSHPDPGAAEQPESNPAQGGSAEGGSVPGGPVPGELASRGPVAGEPPLGGPVPGGPEPPPF